MWEGMLCAGACDNEGTRICESDETWFILNLLELYVSKMWIYYNVKIQCWNVNFSHLCHLLCLDFLIWISFFRELSHQNYWYCSVLQDNSCMWCQHLFSFTLFNCLSLHRGMASNQYYYSTFYYKF